MLLCESCIAWLSYPRWWIFNFFFELVRETRENVGGTCAVLLCAPVGVIFLIPAFFVTVIVTVLGLPFVVVR